MLIFKDDLLHLTPDHLKQTQDTPMDHMMGYYQAATADGTPKLGKVLAVQVNLCTKNEEGKITLMNEQWQTIPVFVLDQDRYRPNRRVLDRLSGPWLRHSFYVYQAPESRGRLYVSNDKDALAQAVPGIDPADRTLPWFRRPGIGVKWDRDPTTGKWEAKPDGPDSTGSLPRWLPQERFESPGPVTPEPLLVFPGSSSGPSSSTSTQSSSS